MTTIQYTDVLQRSQKLSVTEQLMLMEALAQTLSRRSTRQKALDHGIGRTWRRAGLTLMWETYIDQERDSWQS